MPRVVRLVAITFAAAFSLTLSACGSTVQVAGNAASSTGDDGLSLPTSAMPGRSTTPSGQVGPSNTEVPGETRTSRAVGAPGAGGIPGGSASSRPTAGTPGEPTLAPVEVGLAIPDNVGEFFSAFGADVNIGDQAAQTRPVVRWINQHGGVAGHRLVPIFYRVSLVNPQTYDAQFQAICQNFTSDHHVIAALSPVGSNDDELPACFQQHGVLYISSGDWVHNAATYRRYPLMWSPGEADVDQLGSAMVSEVMSHGLAKAGDRVGLLLMNMPAAVAAADHVIVPGFAAHKVAVSKFLVQPPASLGAISGSASQASGAVLKMRAQGIKTVLVICPNMLGFFVNSAKDQGYYPHYVISSLDTPFTISGSSNARVFSGSLGVGYSPVRDVGARTHPSAPTGNHTYHLCARLERSQINSDETAYSALIVCDNLMDLYVAGQRLSTTLLTSGALASAISELGSDMPSATNVSTFLSPTHHAGASSYRVLRWSPKCQCEAYDHTKAVAFH